MAFFARPNLDNLQSKQLTGSTLTLSGETRIATPTGFTLTDGAGGFRPIVATGGTQFDVLTLVGNKIMLKPSSASGGTGVYTCASPTTCTVGGLSSGTAISGCTLSYILEKILVPTVCPTLTAPSSTFSIPISNPYEVGTAVNVIASTSINLGCINPQYTSASSCRSTGVTSHNYIDFNGGSCSCLGANLSCTRSLPTYCVVCNTRTAYGSVSYCAGPQPKDSSGANFGSPLAAGTTTPIACVICGLYPYFYGKVASGGAPAGVNRPTPTCALVLGGTKVVADSNNIVSINFNSTADDYIWFATPCDSITKTKWFIDALNNGTIGGPVTAGGNLFPAYAGVSVACGLWTSVGGSPHQYKVYVSNYQTGVNTIMQLCN
jgi:hypothetical protein